MCTISGFTCSWRLEPTTLCILFNTPPTELHVLISNILLNQQHTKNTLGQNDFFLNLDCTHMKQTCNFLKSIFFKRKYSQVIVIFDVQKPLNFMESHLLICGARFLSIEAIFIKFLQIPVS